MILWGFPGQLTQTGDWGLGKFLSRNQAVAGWTVFHDASVQIPGQFKMGEKSDRLPKEVREMSHKKENMKKEPSLAFWKSHGG